MTDNEIFDNKLKVRISIILTMGTTFLGLGGGMLVGKIWELILIGFGSGLLLTVIFWTKSEYEKYLMGKSKKTKNKSSITDKIQAIMSIVGTIFAFAGLIIAWSSLTKSDSDLQRQINKLDTVANQSLEQTKLLTDQLGVLKEELDFQKQQHELSISNRKAEIEPKLIIELYEYSGSIIYANLINNGKAAKIISYKETIPNDFVIDIPFQYIGEGKEKDITFHYKNHAERNKKSVLNLVIIYEDIDKKTHSIDFKFEDIERLIDEKSNSKKNNA